MIPGQNMAPGAPASSPNGTAPRCEHADGLPPVSPGSDHCPDCTRHPDHPAALVICLTCGWVACADTSPNHHAKAHYQETNHPVTAALPPATHPKWCYIHQRPI